MPFHNQDVNCWPVHRNAATAIASPHDSRYSHCVDGRTHCMVVMAGARALRRQPPLGTVGDVVTQRPQLEIFVESRARIRGRRVTKKPPGHGNKEEIPTSRGWRGCGTWQQDPSDSSDKCTCALTTWCCSRSATSAEQGRSGAIEVLLVGRARPPASVRDGQRSCNRKQI